MDIKHYICLGGCRGVSQAQGVCGAPSCINNNHTLVECSCTDGIHNNFIPTVNLSQKKNSDYKKIISAIVAVALVIIINLIYSYGLKLFFTPKPFSQNSISEQMKDRQECEGLYSKGQSYVTKDSCILNDGLWTENNENNQKQFTQVNGVATEVTGRCDFSNKVQICQQDLQKKYGNSYGSMQGYGNNPSYDRTQFFAGTIFGILLIAISAFLPAEISVIGVGLAIAGVIVLIRSTFQFWSYFSDVWKFGILIIAFIALILLAVKKLKK